MRRIQAAVVAVAVGMGLVGVPSVAIASVPEQVQAGSAQSAPRKGSLVVKVRQPTKAGTAQVVVTGPGPFKVKLKKTRRLSNLRPGTYRVKALTVTSKKWRATATVSKRAVRIGKKRVTVSVDYGTIVSRRLVPARPATVKDFSMPESGLGTLRSSLKLDKGDIVASGVSREAPEGMLVKVVSATGSQGQFVYKVEQATIGEAIPRGSFDATMDTDLSAPTARVAARHGRAGRVSLARRLPYSCTATGSAGVEVSASGGITTQLWADWDWADSSINMKATASASAMARAWMQAAGSCSVPETLLYQRAFTPITVSVGPIPIVIVPKLEMFAGASVGAEGSAEVRGDLGVQAVLNASASKNGLSSSFTGPTVTKSATFTTAAKASGSIYAKAVVTGELYGIAGPHASLKLSILANADAAANPWWSVDAVASAGVGVKVDKCVSIMWKDICLRFDKSKDDLFSKTFRIVDAGGPLNPTTPPAPPAPGVPTDLGGGGVTITPPETGGDAGAGRIPSPTGTGDAWVLSTGLISEVNSAEDGFASTDREDPGDETLTALAGRQTQDATFMKMNVTPSGNRLQIKYIFATEEYPDYVGSIYNDVMGVFVNGQNCATVPGSSSPVSVNTINPGTNSQYFVDNIDGHLPTVMNGLTTTLSCVVPVTPGVPVEVLIGVADASDGAYDSAVALVDGGISSFNG